MPSILEALGSLILAALSMFCVIGAIMGTYHAFAWLRKTTRDPLDNHNTDD